MAQVAQVYLEQAGFKVDLQVSDWATMIQRNKKPELWEVFITHSPFLPEPALNFILSKTAAAGGYAGKGKGAQRLQQRDQPGLRRQALGRTAEADLRAGP